MLRNYFKTAWRSLFKHKASSFINIVGLSVGLAVAMLIGLWIWDELSFDTYHENYNRIAKVMENDTYNGSINTGSAIPLPLDEEIRKNYGSDFKHVVMMSFSENHTLMAGDKKISYDGSFVGNEAPEMFTLKMIEGSRSGLKGPSSMLISESVAKALFSKKEAVGKVIRLDDKASFKVSGVYEDLPLNTTFHGLAFMAPWDFYVNDKDWLGRDPGNWNDNSLFMYVQLTDNADLTKVSEKIKNIKLNKLNEADAKSRPIMFLQPMSKWHLYSEFKNGINTSGSIQYVWLFGIIGIFVLLLACINFMNLSTARSEKRAKEVGIRKTIGSLRSQLIIQFFCESLLLAVLAFIFSLLLVWFILPSFNEVSNKKIVILWSNPLFWLMSLGFTLFTGLIAGSYPALYLSSFKPVSTLKGIFKGGSLAAIPRKVLVVLQFTVSVALIIGTIIVFKQVQFAKNRPVGYNREGLVTIEVTNDDLHKHFNAVRADLLKSSAIGEVAESSSSTTGINYNRSDVNWKGKGPDKTSSFGNISVTSAYGKTVGWQFIIGRDFSSQLPTDSSSLILNEASVKYMGFDDPIGQVVRVGKRDLTVIGVVKDMIMQSPYEPARQSFFYIGRGRFDNVIIRTNPAANTHDAIARINEVCKIYSPSVPFSYRFADEEYAKKFRAEERIGKLSGVFSMLAIFISCLGLFGMASFMTERRTKEIGIRKVLGASVFNLWRLLTRDFIMLIFISLLISIPISYYLMNNWLQNYQYRTKLTWWIFASAGLGAIMVTLFTVSFQTLKAAVVQPSKTLTSE